MMLLPTSRAGRAVGEPHVTVVITESSGLLPAAGPGPDLPKIASSRPASAEAREAESVSTNRRVAVENSEDSQFGVSNDWVWHSIFI